MDVTSLGIRVQSTGITEASKALGGLSTSAGNAEKRVTSLQAAMTRLDAVNSSIAASSGGYMRLLQQQATMMQTMAAASRTAAGGTESLAAAMLLLSASLNLQNQQLQQNIVRQRAMNFEMREAQAAARGLSGSLGALWVTYGNITGMAVGLAIGASLKSMITVGMDVENTLESVRVRGEETVENAKQIREAVLKIGEGIYGPQQVAEAFNSLTLAGLKAKESMLAIGAALNLATAGGTTIEKAAEGLVSIGTAVGAVASDYDYLADGITQAANSSLASVDSITEAVKRASIVNKLYGASFDDILTQTAALAQLGIKNTAAGTAITNFYNNAVGNTNKSRMALEKLGMSFTDATGKAKPLVEAFEEFSNKLNKFDLKSQQNFINDIFGERALRDVEALRDAVRKAADDPVKYGNKLREIQGQIAEAAGTASLQAVQLSLTTTNQMKTVASTLKSSFATAFEQMQPQLLVMTSRMKELFGSEAFTTAVGNLAASLGNLVMFILENSRALGLLLTAFISFKIALGVSALIPVVTTGLMTMATAFGATAVAANGATVATGAFATAIRLLPGIGAVLSVITIALGMLAFNTKAAAGEASSAAAVYSNEYAKALEDEIKRIDRVNQLKREGKTASEALAEATRDEALARYELENDKAVEGAKKRVNDAFKARFSLTGVINSSSKDEELKASQKELKALQDQRVKVEEDVKVLRGKHAEQKAAYIQEQKDAAAAAAAAAGTETYDRKKEDLAGANDQYASIQAMYDARVKAAKKAMTTFEDAENEKFKAGQIGRLQVIQSVAENEIKEYNKVADALQSKLDATGGKKNSEADQARINGLMEANNEALEVSKRKAAGETATYLAKVRDDTQKYQVKSLEEQGKYEEAAAMKWSTEYKAAYQGMTAEVKELGDKYPELTERLRQFSEMQDKMINSGRFKDLLASYDLLLARVHGLFKGVQGNNEGNGMASMIEAAFDASEKYKASLPELEEALKKLKAASDLTNDAGDQKKYEDALAAQQGLADKYKTMWSGVGESISKSLGSAFGDAGKAVGTLITQIVKFNDTDKKTTSQRVKAYGDMTGAAKGYFKEGSTGYKVLATAEKVFRAIELAEAIKVAVVKSGLLSGYLALKTGTDAAAMASGSAYTIAEVAQAGIRATANGIAAVAKAIASMPFPLNIAAGAATAAALIGFGVKMFGGGGGAPTQSTEERQRATGTGTVLGDVNAKSESIQRALDIIAKDSGLQLVHSQSMVVSLKQIVSGIGGLGSILNRAGLTGNMPSGSAGTAASIGSNPITTAVLYGPIGLIADKLLGGVLSRVTGSVMNSIFGGKTSAKGTGLTIDKTTLGNAQNGVNSSQYTNMKKDGGLFSSDKYWTDKNPLGKAADAQFTAIFKNMASTITAAGNMLGIGGTEFTNRLNSFVIDIGQVDLKGLTGDEQQKKLEAVFSALGDNMAEWTVAGIGDFQDVGEGLLETLARMANQVVQVSDVFAVLGKDFTATGYSAMALSRDLVNAAGDLETLTTNTKFFVDNFLTMEERMAPINNSLTAQLKKLGVSTTITEAEFKKLVLSQDLTTTSGQDMYTALIALAPALKTSADYAWDLANGTVELTKAQQRAKDNIDKARSALQDAYDDEVSQLEKTIDKLTSFAAGLKSFQDGLLTGSSSPLTNAQKYAQTLTNFEAISAKAKAGDADAQAGFQAAANELLAASKMYNASSSAYTEDFNRVLKETANLASSTQTQLGTAQASLDALNKQVDGLLTLNESVLTVTQAIINLQAALTAGRTEGLTDKQMGLEVDGSHANGLPFVPKDGYIAELHKGERVLTASEAVEYNSGKGNDSSEVVAALKVMEEKLTDAVEKLAAATVDSNFRATDAAAEKTVEGIDAAMAKKSDRVKPIKLN